MDFAKTQDTGGEASGVQFATIDYTSNRCGERARARARARARERQRERERERERERAVRSATIEHHRQPGAAARCLRFSNGCVTALQRLRFGDSVPAELRAQLRGDAGSKFIDPDVRERVV
jgi:hypothetical protein